MELNQKTTGKVAGVIANLTIIDVDGPVSQNEICYIIQSEGGKELSLLAEVIRVSGTRVYAQVFESTRGLKTGTRVEFTGTMLEVELGPGLLSKIYDGLQNDLYKIEDLFLHKGTRSAPLDPGKKWEFTPIVKTGDLVTGGDWIGSTPEDWITHHIMIPFDCNGSWEIKEIVPKGAYQTSDKIAVIENAQGEAREIRLSFKWPVKRAVKSYKEKNRPFKMLETGIRLIDMFNPMTEGGTGFIPGPFGCGKTVLQHSIAKFADADLIIIVACGERANEVVEIFTDFPELEDPRTKRKLIERTIIVCNTSNMPVAAREASVYTGMTIGEYYRAMGLKVLILADSTSRWAQALREMSNRLEELPGPDAYPIDIPAVIANFYSRAGYTRLHNNQNGSITFLGTVSPAGGNLKEPVTEATRKVARAFYALSQGRADSKRYPAIDPLSSYSKYLEYDEVKSYLNNTYEPHWTLRIEELNNLLIRGREVKEQINILGDDGVPVEYHTLFWKSELIDFILLQQDSFDPIDAATPIERQRYMANSILTICNTGFTFSNFDQVATFFKKLINLFKQMNYTAFQTEKFNRFESEIKEHLHSNETNKENNPGRATQNENPQNTGGEI